MATNEAAAEAAKKVIETRENYRKHLVQMQIESDRLYEELMKAEREYASALATGWK